MPNGEDIDKDKEDLKERLRRAFPDLPPQALRWLSEHPENIQWPDEAEAGVRLGQAVETSNFWQWVESKYDPEDVARLRRGGSALTAIFEHYRTNIFQTRWDIGYAPPRPVPFEALGIDERDWKEMVRLSTNPANLREQLDEWIKVGRINRLQARGIFNELNIQLEAPGVLRTFGEVRPTPVGERVAAREETIRKTTLARAWAAEETFRTLGQRVWDPERGAYVWKKPDREEARIEALRRTGEVGIAGIPEWWLEKYKDEPGLGAFIEQREEGRERATRRQKLRRAWQFTPPRPEFGRAFEEERLALGGTQPWGTWYESKFARERERFRATQPKLEQQYWEGLGPRAVEARVEETWAEYLRKRKPELKEEYATRYPFGIGGRPWAMAPRITRVGF